MTELELVEESVPTEEAVRNLATIQEITALDPIEGADKIVRATVLGWTVVVKKDEFKIGDWCVFFEIDSVLPATEWSKFMEPRRYRVKTCKLRGCLSQGLALPIHTEGLLPPLTNVWLEQDVTSLAGVTKYQPQRGGPGGPLRSQAAGNFPSADIAKTDEPRLQSTYWMAQELLERNIPFYASVKMDGMSGTFVHRSNGEYLVCSRNFWLKPPDETESFSPHWVVDQKYNLKNVIPPGWAIQGEVCGPKIQGNPIGLADYELYVFNLYEIETRRYAGLEELQEFCRVGDLKTVPIDFVTTCPEQFDFQKENFLKLAQGKYANGNHREGIVIRPCKETVNKKGGRLSFKVINNDFLLSQKD